MALRWYTIFWLPGIFFSLGVFAQGDTLSLSGEWRFRADPQDRGMVEKWYSTVLPETIRLPGSMAENGKGEDISVHTQWTASIYDSSWFFDPRMEKYRRPDNLKMPFWLTPAKHYVGAAWYQKEVVIPDEWKGRHVVLFLERPHSETRVWVDDQEVGMQYGFCVGQEFDLTGRLGRGRHRITLCIDNRIKEINVGQDSHSLTDQTQGNWNGVVGKLLLVARPSTWLEDIQVYPDVLHKMVRVHLLIRSLGAQGAGNVLLSAEPFNRALPRAGNLPKAGALPRAWKGRKVGAVTTAFTLTGGMDSLIVELPMEDSVLLWDEFHPALYRLRVRLAAKGSAVTDIRTVTFGMREFGINGRHFEVNGRPVYLRGTVENCVFPLTGYAPMDEAAWERVFRIARSFGLNHMRFHSYCPPEAAFMAADRMGFYLQVEGPSWANHGSSLGDGHPIDQFIYDETIRMARAYGNHPSFCMMAYGNEPRGGHQAEYLTRWVQFWKARDRRRVYTGASVGMSWPLVPDNDFMVKSGPRGLSWNGLPETLSDYDTIVRKFPVPYVTHEMGQWCAFPDFLEIPKYTGVYRAKNFELFREELREQGMGDEDRLFLMSSGKLQALCYKMEIEKSLRTRDGGGFQLLSLTDYPGQGTALVGVLNAFWKEKGYISAKEFSHFCSPTVPLIRMKKFVFTNDEVLEAHVEVYHYGEKTLKPALADWRLRDDKGRVLDKGTLKVDELPVGGVTDIGDIRVGLSGVKKAVALRLEVSIRGTSFYNDWHCWVYPAGVATGGVGDTVYYCTELDDRARQVLEQGGKVFLNAYGKVVKGKEVIMRWTPVFWNTSWFKMRPPHTLGLVCDPSNPIFRDFPTDDYSDVQWWDIIERAQVMHLEDFPKGFRPLVQPIDTWFLNRRLGLIFEARVGKGRLVVSGADLSPDIGFDRPAARQLYYSIQRYMQSDDFRPVYTVDCAVVKDLFTTGSRLVYHVYTKSGPDELRPKSTK